MSDVNVYGLVVSLQDGAQFSAGPANRERQVVWLLREILRQIDDPRCVVTRHTDGTRSGMLYTETGMPFGQWKLI